MNWKFKKFADLSTEEIYGIIKLRIEVFIIEQNCIYQDCDGRDQAALHLFVQADDRIVAYLRILPKGSFYEEICIGRLVVQKDYRGQGLARELMLKAISFIESDLRENEIKIQAQVYLTEFYKSLGFVQVSEEYLEDNLPHIDMLKNSSL
ncbi:MAG: GNAT family N-acetyltransferase [Ruminococcaceae bacterium]|nr:GNAT family N-acetyltransferase [Oscillospiraceae bacterium]